MRGRSKAITASVSGNGLSSFSCLKKNPCASRGGLFASLSRPPVQLLFDHSQDGQNRLRRPELNPAGGKAKRTAAFPTVSYQLSAPAPGAGCRRKRISFRKPAPAIKTNSGPLLSQGAAAFMLFSVPHILPDVPQLHAVEEGEYGGHGAAGGGIEAPTFARELVQNGLAVHYRVAGGGLAGDAAARD